MLTDRKNSMWLSFQFVIIALIYLITLKINIVHYGDQDFGLWIVLVSIWSFSFNLDFGIGTTVVRYIAKYKSDEAHKINKFISTSFCIFLIAGALLIIFGYLASHILYFSNTRVISADKREYFVTTFQLYGIAFIVQYMIFFYKSIFDGLSNFVTSSKFTIFQNILVLSGVILIWILKLNLIYLSLVYIISHTTILILYIIILKKRQPEIEIKFRSFDKSILKEIVFFSFSVQATNIFYSLIDVVIKNIIANYYQASYATVYETARKFALAISGLFFNAFKYVLPKTSALTKPEEINKFLKDDIIRYTKYGLTYSGFAFGVMSIPLIFIIQLFFGKPEIILTFIILAMPEAINNYGYCVYNFILGQGKIHLLALIQLNNLILTALSVMIGFIIFRNPMGMLGYFFSVIVGNVIMLIYLKKRHGILLGKMLKEISMYKLLLFEAMLFGSMLFILNNTLNVYIIFSIVTVVSIVMFGAEIYHHIEFFYREISKKLKNV